MKFKKSLFTIATALLMTTLAGCQKDDRTVIKFWTGFGKAVENVLLPLIRDFEEENPDIRVDYETKGGYPNLQIAINGAIASGDFPHVANGYPDHFASYANTNTLLKLNTALYINNPDPNIGVDISQYYADYMNENNDLIPGNTVGIPFNKSTEVMIVNRSFFDLAKIELDDPTIEVPTTWQELKVVGPKLRQAAQKWLGKLVILNEDGTISTISKPEKPTAELLATVKLDMTAVSDIALFRPFSWDSTSNFFITALRQWGGKFTEKGPTFQTGKVLFHKDEWRAKTIEMLTEMYDLYQDRIIGIPSSFGTESFGSKYFKEGRVVMTVSSSAGSQQNLPQDVTDYPFKPEVHPILFNEDYPEQKSVISQGTNLALFAKGQATDPEAQKERMAAWKLIRYLTYVRNHEFAKGTSYYPVFDGSLLEPNEDDPRYQDYKLYTTFLYQTDMTPDEIANETAQAKIVRETAIVQQEEYTVSEKGWNKFVDPGFIGSSDVRNEVENLFSILFSKTNRATAASDTINQIMGKLNQFA